MPTKIQKAHDALLSIVIKGEKTITEACKEAKVNREWYYSVATGAMKYELIGFKTAATIAKREFNPVAMEDAFAY